VFYTSSIGSKSWTHTPVGTPAGAMVFTIQDGQGNNNPSNDITGITYGGVAMSHVTSSPFSNNAGTRDGVLTCFFLGSSVPSGAQTVVVSCSAGWRHRSVSVTVTATGDVAVDAVGTLTSASIDDPSVNVATTAATETVIYGLLHRDSQDAANVDGGTDYTTLQEAVFTASESSSATYSLIRRTVNGSGGTIAVDWTTPSALSTGVLAVAFKKV
jgi:hypothetical protein